MCDRNYDTPQQNGHSINNQQPFLDIADAFTIATTKVQSNKNTVAMEMSD